LVHPPNLKERYPPTFQTYGWFKELQN